MADVGREARLALDACLHGGGHGVERVDDAGEVRVPLRSDARVEVAGGDAAGSGGQSVDGAQQPSARPHADGRGEQRDHRRTDHQRQEQDAQRLLGVVERERLEVLRPDLLERDADAEEQVVTGAEALRAGDSVLDGRFQLRREVLRGEHVGDGRATVLGQGVVEAVLGGRHPFLEQLAEVGLAGAQQAQHLAGVADRLLLGLGLALVDAGSGGRTCT